MSRRLSAGLASMTMAMAMLMTGPAAAEERILDYHSDILVRRDGWIEVTETIRVRAEGRAIRRGIYRDYPVRYEDRFGNDVVVDYEPLAVSRNGLPEDFHSEPRANGVRTWFGSAERLLDAGEHTYEYRYRAGRMLGFYETHDELYWNVTGQGWEFPIDDASAAVRFGFALPADAAVVEAYTGAYGERGDDWRARTDPERGLTVDTTDPLSEHEGLTIVVRWPKGHVEAPGAAERVGWLLSDNANLLVAGAGLVALLAWYIPVWRRYGRDPARGVAVTRYEPPADLSPASLRYIRRMHYDDKTMTVAVVNLAVKGYLRIRRDDDEHVLERLDAPPDPRPPLAPGERELLDALFEDGPVIELDTHNRETLARARARHNSSLKKDYANRYFRTNGALNLPALLIALGTAAVALAIRGPTPFVIAILVAMAAVIVVFAILMKQPTGLGRKVLDELEGFRDYLEIAEKDEMNLRNPPEKTPVLFERYLPFALALGVEQAWAERFAGVFAGLRAPDGSPYHPAWYHGSWTGADAASAASRLTGDLGSAISSSVSAPGSSSGGGGGGFSGGGGGGGGGGGW